MNLVGKIFTFLIFLMSLVFGTLALCISATHTNWRTAAEAKAQQYDGEKKENAELVKKKKELEEERKIEADRATKRIAKLEQENQDLTKERVDNEAEIAKLQTSVRDAVGGMRAAHETLAKFRQEVEVLREEIKVAQADRDKNFKTVVTLTDDVHNAVAERQRLDKINQTLIQQLAEVKECIGYFKIDLKNYKAKDPPAGTRGQVTAANRPDMVEISLGSDDGIRKGHKLEVVRVDGNSTYVGRIEVIETSPDRAVCRPVPNMLRSPIQRGDRVFDRL